MVEITDKKAEEMRAQLAAHEAQKAEAAAAEQAARNAEQLAALQPAVDLIDENFTARVEAMRSAAMAVGGADWDITTLINNCVVCLDSLGKRIQQRKEQLAPPTPADDLTPAPSGEGQTDPS